MNKPLNALFVTHAAEILAATANGFSASQFIKLCNAYAFELNVDLPHTSAQYEAPNKRTALADNLMRFEEAQRYRIIRELCEYPSQAERPEVRKLKLMLITRYGHLAGETMGAEVNEALVEQTRHWLEVCPDALRLYNDAMHKYENKVFQRNVLDDTRLSLEKLCHQTFGNEKSLENQLSLIGAFVKERGGSAEFVNMFQKLIDYYTKYQNNYVKHDDAVIEEEIEFMLELSSSFMKHLVRLSQR